MPAVLAGDCRLSRCQFVALGVRPHGRREKVDGFAE
jgi:hypothetical protein